MLTYDTALTASLNAQTNKSLWSSTLSAALGTSTVLRCFRDANAAAANPFLTGTEFLNVALTGAMGMNSGNIISFGTAGATSIRLAADLTTGSSIWRIEGNGHFIQGSLGLVGSGSDFMVTTNPTPTSGIGFVPGTSILAPTLLPSGTGPAVPALTSSAPHSVTIEDWSSGSAVPLTPMVFDTRVNDFVFQDPELAAEIGDVGVYQCSTASVHPATSATGYDQFQFGAQLYVANQYNTAVGNVPLYQVLIGCKPYGTNNWPTYPGADTYDLTKMTTFPKPFKAVIRDVSGNVLYTHEMNNYPRFYASTPVAGASNAGNGTITQLSVNQAQAAAETFTVIATSPSTFSVTSTAGQISSANGGMTVASVNGIGKITLGGGAGYTSAPQVVFTDTVGTGATALAFIDEYGVVTSLQWASIGSTTGGSGGGGPAGGTTTYTASATVSLVGGGYTTQATATVNFATSQLRIAGQGGPWTTAPTVNITDSTGTGAAATYMLDGSGYFAGFNITSPGHGYTNPSITLTGGTLASNGVAPTATPVAHLGATFINKAIFTIMPGTVPFAVGDTFTFTTSMATLPVALPINSPQLAQTYGINTGDEMRPLFSCGQLLPWQNTPTKASANAGKYFNGVASYALAPSVAKLGTASNPVYPMLLEDQAYQENGLAHMYAMPAHAWPKDTTSGDLPGTAVANATPVTLTNQTGSYTTTVGDIQSDQYLFSIATYHVSDGKQTRSQGWMYEPGAVNGHDWMTGPGGVRFDRVSSPSVLSVWASNNNAIRMEGNVSFRMLLDNWSLAYFNHHTYNLTNVQTFATIPDAQSLAGSWGHIGAYYGQSYYNSVNYGDGTLAHQIPLLGIANGGSPVFDKNKQMIWNGWLPDSLHAYCAPGWMTLMLNSPMHAVAQKFRYNQSVMALLGGSSPTADPLSYFMIRIHAWRMLQYVMVWKLASTHSLGFSRAEIEARWQTELEHLWDTLLAPAFVQNATDINSTCLRNLGSPAVVDPNGGNLTLPSGAPFSAPAGTFMTTPGGSMCFYMSHVLALMKQTGAWTRMCSLSTKCSNALHQILWCLDTQSIDYINATQGRLEQGYAQLTPIFTQGGYDATNNPTGHVFTAADFPANWGAWNTASNILPLLSYATASSYGPSCLYRAQTDWVTNGDGSPAFNTNGNRDAYSTQHLRAQHAFMHRDFFPEVSFAGQVPANTAVSGTSATATTTAVVNGVTTQVPNAPLIAACAIYQSFYDKVVAQVAADTTLNTKMSVDWASLIPSSGKLNPPTVLGTP